MMTMKQGVMKAQFTFEIWFLCTESLKNCWKDGLSKSLISLNFNFTAIQSFDISNIGKFIFSRMELLKNKTDFYVTEVKKEGIRSYL